MPFANPCGGRSGVTYAELTFLRKDLPRASRQKPIHKCFVIARHLILVITAVSSAWRVVGTEKLGHGPRYRFRLFQQQKMPGIG